MRVEILSCSERTATCKVSHGDDEIEFTVGCETEAHKLLRLMVQNAIAKVVDRQSRQLMDEWNKRQ